MSGQLSPAMAQAAGAHALRAQADAAGVSIGRLVAARFRAGLEARKGREPDSLPGRTWRAMSERTRVVLVMLAASTDGNPQDVARQPWESFSDGDKASMAACARELGGNLRDAACLF